MFFASRARYQTAGDIARFYASATEAIRAVPGVTEVSSGNQLPFSGNGNFDVFIQEERGDQGANNPATAMYLIDQGYDRALGIPLLRGRSFLTSDDSSAEHVVVINDVLAKRNYAGIDPIGRLINWNGQAHWRIVGVVGSVRVDKLWEEGVPILYVPVQQALRRSRFFVVRSSLPPSSVLASAREALRRVDPTVALTDPGSMEERINASLGPQRFRAALMVVLGSMALGLAVIGIYSVIAYSVARRTREIGIRMALGEASSRVRWSVIGDALGVASIGVAAGVGLSLLAGKWLAVFLVDVSPRDPVLLASAAAALVVVVAAAAHGPARRASRVDPMKALRAD